jgi:uncharacterized membrane protein
MQPLHARGGGRERFTEGYFLPESPTRRKPPGRATDIMPAHRLPSSGRHQSCGRSRAARRRFQSPATARATMAIKFEHPAPAGTASASRNEARIRRLFHVSLLLKAAHSVLEIVGGILLVVVSREGILKIVNRLTQEELFEDPHDWIANYLVQGAQNLSAQSKSFAAFYLLSHGVIKLGLIVAILRNKLWAYPAFMIALVLLIAYQSYKLLHGLSIGLAALTVLDLIVLALTWHEYRFVRATAHHA